MKLDKYEKEVLAAFEAGTLKPVASKDELARIRAAARATAIKDQRINIRLSAGDLRDIQVKALQEGMPYQTLIASVLHKYATGRLAETGTNPPPTA
jgi:predicted DNA binding CopG/RHH family protein